MCPGALPSVGRTPRLPRRPQPSSVTPASPSGDRKGAGSLEGCFLNLPAHPPGNRSAGPSGAPKSTSGTTCRGDADAGGVWTEDEAPGGGEMAPPGKRPGQTVPPVLPSSCVQLDAPPFTPVSHRRKVGSALRLGPSTAFGDFLLPGGRPAVAGVTGGDPAATCWRDWFSLLAEHLETERSAFSLDTRKELCCRPGSKGTVSKSCRVGFTESLASEARGALWDV